MSYAHKKIALSAVTLVLAVGSTVSAFADNSTSDDAGATPTTTTQAPAPQANARVSFDFSQVVAPMLAREDAIANAWGSEFEALGSALSDRRTELSNAYSLKNKAEVRAAVKAAHKKYHQAVKTARSNSNQERKNAWDVFNKAVKSLKNPTLITVEGLTEKNEDTK